MSTILKALRRLEQEKAAEQPSNLDGRVAELEAGPRSGRGGLAALLMLCVLLGVGGGALLAWLSLPRIDPSPPPGAVALEPVAAASRLEGLELQPHRLATAEPDPVSRVPERLVASGPPRSSSTSQVRPLAETVSGPPAPPSRIAPDPISRDLPPVAVLQRVAHSEGDSADSGETPQEPEVVSIVQRVPSPELEEVVLAERARREAAPVIVRRPLPALIVKRTIWHPDSERRLAVVQIAGRPEPLDLREGDSLEGLTVIEITPSGVSFDHGGVELYKRLGTGG